ncbi:ECA polysaccharide chain length modulation protein [Brenneria uluponensis]|uniref:ECA polysaccharide chain length modulation protein n=1 Tax=Brenneria uluponensis TaxID=3057057 RepID=UPI0028E670B6|nr:ECA polysaccharide chain length modulation protein [Brenneria ulupoensis]
MRTDNISVLDEQLENTLDLRGVFCALWCGKVWVLGITALFVLFAVIYSYLAPQKWGAIAVTDKPTVNMLNGFYSQQQFLRNLGTKAFPVSGPESPSVAADVYAEFIMQLAAYDTQRDFWLQSEYYLSRKEGNRKADAILLDKLINNIQLTSHNDVKKTNDSVKLTAETATDADMLLRQYINFSNQRAITHLNDELKGLWIAKTTFIRSQIKQQEAVSLAIYNRELHNVEQGLTIARQQGINHNQTSKLPDALPVSEMFLLGTPVLMARLASLKANGPQYDIDYDQNRAILTILDAGPALNKNIQTYRYLRTPEEPVKRDSPRRLFLLAMWGAIGLLIGAGVALVRHPR